MSQFKYSVGPWNVSEGADMYGPAVRSTVSLSEMLERFKAMGFDAIQFHDDDVVPDIDKLTEAEIIDKAGEIRRELEKHNLAAEFVAPRLWMDAHFVDGAYTSNWKEDRDYALWRSYRSIDIARALGCDKIVLWLAREGTLCSESKNAVESINHLIDAINQMLAYDKTIKILIEPKPNEPIDRSFCGTIGHVMGVASATKDPSRVGGLVESAHAVLCGLDPANEFAFALALGKLWGVHLNDQNGLKYDQDRAFGAENLRQAFNQIKLLVENNYGANGEYVGLDVKAMRTTPNAARYKHLENSLKIARMLERKAKAFDYNFQKECVKNRDYEALEMYVLDLLMGS